MKKNLLIYLLLLFSISFYSQSITMGIDGKFTFNTTSNILTVRYKETGSTNGYQYINYNTSFSKFIYLNPLKSWDFGFFPYSNNDITLNSNYVGTFQSVNYNINLVNNNTINETLLNDGWRLYNSVLFGKITTSSFYNCSYSNGLLINYSNGLYNQPNKTLLISPKLIDLQNGKRIKIKANRSNQFSGSGILKVGTISSINDLSNIHELQTIQLTSNIQEHIIYTGNFHENDKYIVFYTDTFFDYNSLNLYEFKYEDYIPCNTPTNASITNISGQTATFDFNSEISQNNWLVEIKNVTDNYVRNFNITSKPFVIPDIVGDKTYKVKVKAQCDIPLFSGWSNEVTFSTNCSNILDYYETSFLEDYHLLDPCWSKIGMGIGLNSFYTTPINARTGNKCIVLNNNFNSQNFLITPYIDNINTSKRIKFYMYGNGDSYYIEDNLIVGTMSNKNDPTTFVPFKTISKEEINDKRGVIINDYWKEHIIYLDNYDLSLNHHYIAIKTEKNSNLSSNYNIDDFKYETAPICKEPFNLFQNNITENSANLKWMITDNSDTIWEIQYGLTGFQLGSGTILTVTTNPYNLTNLSSSTNYDFYVRTKCGNGYSNWSDRGTFKTKCPSVSVGFTDNFDNDSFNDNNSCWTRGLIPVRESRINADNQTYYSNFGQNSTKCLALNNHTFQLNNINYKVTLITPKLNNLNNTKKISFWYKYYSQVQNQNLEIGTLSNPNDINSFVLFKTITLSNNALTNWTNLTIEFNDYNLTNQFIGFRFSSNTSAQLLIDNFSYLENTHPTPTNLSAQQNGENSVLLSWNSNSNNSTIYEIEYGIVNDTNTITTTVNSTNESFTLSNLIIGRKYKYRIRNVFTDNIINWSENYEFKVLCTSNLPFSENFDNYNNYESLNNQNNCIEHTTGNNLMTYISNFYIPEYSSSPNSLLIQNLSNSKDYYYISPYIPNFNNNTDLKFFILPLETYEYMDKIVVGTIKNPIDYSTFEPFEEIDITNIPLTGKEIFIDFNNYTGQNKIFAIKVKRYGINNPLDRNSLYIDDINLYQNNNCIEPINIVFSEITDNSCKISWNQNNNTNTIIEYGPEGFIVGTGTIINTNSNEILINGLLNSSNYQFYFRTNCSSNISNLIGPKKIQTLCTTYNLPWSESFNNMNEYGTNILPNCFYLNTPTLVTKNTNQPVSNIFRPNQILSGNNDTTYIWSNNNGHGSFGTPPFNLSAGITYSFKLFARKSYHYDFQSIKIAVIKGNNIIYKIVDLYSDDYFTLMGYEQLSEYNFSQKKFYFTPIENGIYTFIVITESDSSATNMLIDDLSLNEGYQTIINSDFNLDFNSSYDNRIILENSENSRCIQQNNSNILFNFSDKTLKNSIVESKIWKENESSISKLNFKIDPTNMQHPIVLKFDLKQNYDVNRDHSLFRVIINGNQIGETLKPNTPNNDEYETKQFDLTSYASSPIYVSLQHLGNYNTNNLNNAYLDNLRIENFLSSESILNSEFQIFPNPTKDIITIKNNSKIDIYQLYSIDGKLIEENKIEENEFNVDLSKYNSGIYLLKLISENKTYTEKIIKQ